MEAGSSHNAAEPSHTTQAQEADPEQPDEQKKPALPLRRSLRVVSKGSSPFAETTPARAKGKKRKSSSSSTMSEARRNPKRKASETSKATGGNPSNLLEEALKPLEPQEIEQWEGWVELESEPAFFNIILRELGVGNAKASELFTLDQDSIDFLPKPIYGLIFLFQYLPGLDETDNDEPAADIWFANQTTHNACATVAMLNIVMNAPDIELGDQLKEFKESTKDLSTPLRGHRLSCNPFIRSIHNSFTRRMDHLNADLALENEASEPKPKKSKTRTAEKKGKGKARRKKTDNMNTAFHFIAYVPAEGCVWELDGLKTKPHKLGTIESEDWTSVVRPLIEARMLQYEDSQLSFNLLALCRSPLAMHSQKIAQGLAALRYLHDSIHSQPHLSSFRPPDNFAEEAIVPAFLSEFQLTLQNIEKTEAPQHWQEAVSAVKSEEDAHEVYGSLVVEIKATIGEYRAELMAMADDEQRVQGRKKDYGPALHKWVSKLAEKGVLEDLIKNA